VDEQRQEFYMTIRQNLIDSKRANAENYDKSILSLSTASLGFSLAFLTRSSSSNPLVASGYLEWSWILFIGAISLTLASFLVSQQAIKRQLDRASRYYKKNDRSALDEVNWLARWVTWLAYGAGVAFLIAICLTARFVSLNTGGDRMAEQKPFTTHRTERPFTTDRPGVPFKKGAPVPDIEPVETPLETPVTAPSDKK